MININKMSEGIDYEMVPSPVDNEQAWSIRFLTGPFVETVISFGNLQVNGKEEAINFNFSVKPLVRKVGKMFWEISFKNQIFCDCIKSHRLELWIC